ncbi:hypothetical protein ANO11243_093090 [Dothideomycetidae sp. 11243]|nr:hypothetical protein ANO11243_093090 [fungal sp. No.11243]
MSVQPSSKDLPPRSSHAEADKRPTPLAPLLDQSKSVNASDLIVPKASTVPRRIVMRTGVATVSSEILKTRKARKTITNHQVPRSIRSSQVTSGTAAEETRTGPESKDKDSTQAGPLRSCVEAHCGEVENAPEHFHSMSATADVGMGKCSECAG